MNTVDFEQIATAPAAEAHLTFQSAEGPVKRPDGEGWVLIEMKAGTCYSSNPRRMNVGGIWLLWARQPSSKA